jgi:NFU1 iron-sulfur cluster scaffold homolog, mitochondrial
LGFSVLEVLPTPNPNAMKFVVDRTISAQPRSFFDAESAKSNLLAEALFAIPGVTSVLLLGDFVTVNKLPKSAWATVRKEVKRILETTVSAG